MNILQLLSGTGFIVINKAVAHRLGLYPAIMLGELASKYLYYKENGMLTEDGYFFVTIEDMQKSTTLSRHKQDEGLKVLEDAKFIETVVKGLPGKRHFKIAEDVIFSQFVKNSQTTLWEPEDSLCKNLTTNNKNIDIENKEILNNNNGIEENLTEEKSVEVLFPAYSTSKETEFKDSLAFEQSVFEAAMSKEIKLNIDVFYYKNLVDEWCEKLRAKDKRKKRTARGWIATVRQFMRSDNTAGKLKFTGNKKSLQDAEAKAFLSI